MTVGAELVLAPHAGESTQIGKQKMKHHQRGISFIGMLFVANAAFNNLGKPVLSTWFNWGRATVGTIPFALVGAAYWGAEGVMAMTAVGSVLFGIASAIMAFKIVNQLETNQTA